MHAATRLFAIFPIAVFFAHADAQSRLWQPVADPVYLQEVGSKIASQNPVTAVAVLGDCVYVQRRPRRRRHPW